MLKVNFQNMIKFIFYFLISIYILFIGMVIGYMQSNSNHWVEYRFVGDEITKCKSQGGQVYIEGDIFYCGKVIFKIELNKVLVE